MDVGVEQAERALEDRAHPIVGGQHVDGALLHQVLEAVGERGLAAADRTEQVHDLLLLLEPLGGMPEEADDALDGLLQAVEVLEGGIDLDGAVHEDAPEARIPGRCRRARARRWHAACALRCRRTSTGPTGSLPSTRARSAGAASGSRTPVRRRRRCYRWLSCLFASAAGLFVAKIRPKNCGRDKYRASWLSWLLRLWPIRHARQYLP